MDAFDGGYALGWGTLGTRDKLIGTVAAAVLALPATGVRRVGVDGVDGVGKTVFADELAGHLAGTGHPVLRAGVDGFHRPRQQRHARGARSPEGFYLDSYDYPALRRVLLDPLGPGGSREYRTAVFDHRADAPVDIPSRRAPDGAVLVFDGIFLHRPELRDCWDLSVFLDAPLDVTVARCAARDGSRADPADPVNRRYVDGQARYLAQCRPRERATMVVDNTDLAAPALLRGATPATG